jgi:hypothetical protein
MPEIGDRRGRAYPLDIVLTILHVSLRESGRFFKLPGKERSARHGTGNMDSFHIYDVAAGTRRLIEVPH